MKVYEPKTLILSLFVFSISMAFLNPSGLKNRLFEESPEKPAPRYVYEARKNAQPRASEPRDLEAMVKSGIDYLVSVQFENGGWGAGSHSNQQMIDATRVSIDAATTAFSAMALMRAGNTLESGPYQSNLKKALNYILELIEQSPDNSPLLSDVSGTQPQVKLGQNVDATMCSQFLMRIVDQADANSDLNRRINQAIDKCILKIKLSQDPQGNINGGGWAPVLQSAMANNALEMAYQQGREVDEDQLRDIRRKQKQNMDASGAVKTEKSAGVALYSVTSVQRATAQEARKVKKMMAKAKKDGLLTESTPVNREELKKINTDLSDAEIDDLVNAYEQNESSRAQLEKASVMRGFGNNGGEEFLSFMLTSESLVITGGEDWEDWKKKMEELLGKIQNQDGSWNGHHCITSPVFCTSAAILALTAENDREILIQERDKKEDK